VLGEARLKIKSTGDADEDCLSFVDALVEPGLGLGGITEEPRFGMFSREDRIWSELASVN
jgi:hypothetical protein